jgi:hypothetical protein
VNPTPEERFSSFTTFYPFYLKEHSHPTSRRLHFFGSLGALWCLVQLAITGQAIWLVAGLVFGYAMAWIGHFFFEKNRPATFKYPIYSLMGDWVMFKDILIGKIKF